MIHFNIKQRDVYIVAIVLFLVSVAHAEAGFLINRSVYIGLTEGLVGYWSFDGPDMSQSTNNVWALDRSGQGNNGRLVNTATSSVRVAGKIGQTLEFDGSNDYVDISNISLASFTMSVWLYRNSNNTNDVVIGNDQGSGVFEFRPTPITLMTANGASSATWSVVPSIGVWTHVLIRFDRSTNNAELFFDGVSQGVSICNCDFTPTNDQVTWIGRDTNTNRMFDGKIDEVRIYNRVLSAEEIKRLYKIGSTLMVNKPRTDTLKEGLVGYWSFDGPDMSQSTNNVWALDRSGQGNIGRLINTATSSIRKAGKIGQALDFDGSNDYVINTSLSPSISGDASISVWFKINSLSTLSNDRILDLAQAADFGMQITVQVDGDVEVDNSGGITTSIITPAPKNDGTWHHAILTRSGTSYTFYVDSISIGTSGGTAPTYTRLFVGQRSDIATDTPFPGLIDEVRIYNRVLTEQEIKRLYKIGSTLMVNKPRTDTLKEGLVGYWSFDGPDMSQSTNNVWALDRSGQGNNGRLLNMATSSVRKAGKIGQALDFDNIDDLINAGSGTNLNNLAALTVVAWVNPRSLGENSGGRIIQKGADSGAGWRFIMVGDAQVTFLVNFATTNAWRDSANNAVPFNQWRHIVATWSGSTAVANIKIYIDGVETAYAFSSSDGSGAQYNDAADNLSIGNASDSTRTFNGLIDEVRVYNRALNADEIRRLYNMGR